MEDFYGFTIDSSATIKEIVTGGNTTYTMKVVKDTLETNKLNNLIVRVDSLNTTKAWIFSYNLLENLAPSVHNSFSINFSSIDIKDINYNTNNTSTTGKLSADCIEGVALMCNNDGSGGTGEPHAAGPICCSQGTHLYTVFTTNCTDGGSELGDVVTSPHGGGGGSNTTVANPCNKIKNQNTKFPTLKQSLVTLATTTSQNYENGMFIDNTATATTANPEQTIPSNTTNGGTIPLNMNPTNKYVMLAHTHDSYGTDGTGTYSIFSWDDLTTINRLIQTNHIDNSNFVFYVITADGTRYALTIDSSFALNKFFYYTGNLPIGTQLDEGRLLNTETYFKKYYLEKKGLIKTNSNKVDDKKNFLNFIKEAGLGVTLFEADATFSTYQKLSISDSGVVTPTPCN